MRTLLLLCMWMLPLDSAAQLLSDTLFTWQGYGRSSTCRIRQYMSAPDEKKPFTILISEVAENDGPSTLDDVQHLVELVGRTFEIDPEAAFWIFHWGGFSFSDAHDNAKEFFFRATFRRSAGGSLGTPLWRLIDRPTVVAYTDRAFR